MLPPTPLPLRPGPREWFITACVTALVTLLLWIAIAYLRDPHYSPEFVAGLKDLDAKRGPEAQRMFDHALLARPADSDLYTEICRRAMEAKQWPVLAEYAERGLQKCPKADADTRLQFCVWRTIGLTEAKTAGWQEAALQAAKQAYDLAPNNPQVQNLYAYNLADLDGDAAALKQAAALLTTALQTISALPDAPDAQELRAVTQDSYGWTRCKQGDYPAAIDACNQSIAGLIALDSPGDSLKTVYYHLGVAQHRSGDNEAARSSLQRALSFDASYKEASDELASVK